MNDIAEVIGVLIAILIVLFLCAIALVGAGIIGAGILTGVMAVATGFKRHDK